MKTPTQNQHSGPPRPAQPRGKPKWLFYFSGLLAALLLCGAPVAVVILGGWADPLAAMLARSFLGAVRPTPVFVLGGMERPGNPATPRPGSAPATAMATSELDPSSFQARYDLARNDIARANGLMREEDWGGAVLVWDEVLQQVPEYGYGYARRAEAYMQLVTLQRYRGEYERNLQAALSDLDQAIALQPIASGDVYYQRYAALGRMGGNSPTRKQDDYWSELALESLRLANHYGNAVAWSERLPAFELAELGRCDQALAEAEALVAAQKPGEAPSAGLNTALAEAYLCQGDLDLALKHIDMAIQIYDSWERHWTRAVILYNLGRSDEALQELDRLIDEDPYYDGYRYYFRALIHYDRGDEAQANQDLSMGAANTWGDPGFGAYIEAQRALQAGRTADAIALLQQAEVILERAYGPFLARVQRELRELGGEPLDPPIDQSYAPTPAPALAPTPTPWPGAIQDAGPAEIIHYVDFDQGAGPFAIHPSQKIAFHLIPDSPLSWHRVSEMRVSLLPLSTDGATYPTGIPPALYLWDPNAQQWEAVVDTTGNSPVLEPERFFFPGGDVYLLVVGLPDNPFYVGRVGVWAKFNLADGSTVERGRIFE